MSNYDTLAEFGQRCGGISRQAVADAIRRGQVLRGASGIDPAIPQNQAYIQSALVRRGGADIALSNEAGPSPAKKKPKPRVKPSDGNGPSKINNNNGDLSHPELLSRTDAERLKVVEQILNYQIKTQKERQELVERALVKRVWAKLYAVDTAELHPLGEKVAADVAALCKVDNSETTLAIKKIIDRHIFKALQHSKRLMNDFLKKVGEEEI